MTGIAYRDADREAAHCGNMRARLAKWWRPLVATYCAGAVVVVWLLAFDALGLINLSSLHPWGSMLIISAACQMIALPALLIVMPWDVFLEWKMRRAFRRRLAASGKVG
jgi:hypothetical protein